MSEIKSPAFDAEKTPFGIQSDKLTAAEKTIAEKDEKLKWYEQNLNEIKTSFADARKQDAEVIARLQETIAEKEQRIRELEESLENYRGICFNPNVKNSESEALLIQKNKQLKTANNKLEQQLKEANKLVIKAQSELELGLVGNAKAFLKTYLAKLNQKVKGG